MKKELGLQDYIFLFFRRKWIIFMTTIGVIGTTAVYVFTRPPVYESTSTFMIESREIGFSEGGMSFTEHTRPLGYYDAIIQSRTFRSRLMENLLADPALMKNQIDTKDLENMVASSLVLTRSSYSDFIQLISHAPIPVFAYQIALYATDLLKNRCQEIDREELENAVQFINAQIEISRQNLEKTERELQQFQDRADVNISITGEDGVLLNEMATLENTLTTVQTEKEMAKSNLEAFQRRLAQLQGPGSVGNQGVDSPAIRTARNQIAQMEQEKNDLIIRRGASHPEVMSLERRIELQKRSLVNLIMQETTPKSTLGSENERRMWNSIQEKMIQEQLNVFVLENRERYYKRLISDFRQKHPRMMENAIEMMRMTRAKTVAENLYTFLLQKGEEAKIKAATGSGGLRIIDHPVMPVNPISTNIIKRLIVGFFVGLGLGIGLALLREYMDTTIQSKEDITSLTNYTMLGMVPRFNGYTNTQAYGNRKRGKKTGRRKDDPSDVKNLINFMKPKSIAVESYRSIRANLNFVSVDQRLNDFVISSPNPVEGKTLSSANLAIAFALSGKKIILVDADIRKPRQHTLFNLKGAAGLVDCLVDNKPLSMIMHSSVVKNLTVIPCGKVPPNPTEIIGSRKMSALIRELRKHADLVIYDSAPLLPVTDTRIIASQVDGILLVVRHGFTIKAALANAQEYLETSHAKVLGVLLNQAPVGRRYVYYNYNYSYYHYHDY